MGLAQSHPNNMNIVYNIHKDDFNQKHTHNTCLQYREHAGVQVQHVGVLGTGVNINGDR